MSLVTTSITYRNRSSDSELSFLKKLEILNSPQQQLDPVRHFPGKSSLAKLPTSKKNLVMLIDIIHEINPVVYIGNRSDDSLDYYY